PPVPPTGGHCPTMTTNNLFPTYRGASAGCNSSNQQTCVALETVTFTAQPNAYDLTCDNHTIVWNFGDNSAQGSGATTTHQYAVGGSYTVRMTVSNSSQSNFTSTIPVTVTGGGGHCPTMTSNNLYATYQNQARTSPWEKTPGPFPDPALTSLPRANPTAFPAGPHTSVGTA